MSYLVYWTSVGSLIIVSDQAYNCGVICKLDYGVQDMNRCTVVDEHRVEESVKHTDLWDAGV